ncbi:MAG: C_GCAxxG_C_C family protein [Lachnospiraceae bacterium]|nr:C_GCAxxG_C_C family protein [Candidatus Equihabitans merdae]
MMEVTDIFYNGGLNCAESTLHILIERGVIDAPIETVRMMTGFGGGMQRGEVCGALVGAIAAIGWVKGRTETGQDRKPTADAVRTLLKQFEEEFGAIRCEELRQLHSGGVQTKSDKMYRACTPFVERAAEMVEELLKEA